MTLAFQDISKMLLLDYAKHALQTAMFAQPKINAKLHAKTDGDYQDKLKINNYASNALQTVLLVQQTLNKLPHAQNVMLVTI